MSEKIEQWRLKADNKDAWRGKINVTLNGNDLQILVSALNSSAYEGVISFEERDYVLNKLNISLA